MMTPRTGDRVRAMPYGFRDDRDIAEVPPAVPVEGELETYMGPFGSRAYLVTTDQDHVVYVEGDTIEVLRKASPLRRLRIRLRR